MLVDGGKVGGAKDRGNSFMNGQDAHVEMRWCGHVLLRLCLWSRPHVPHHQHDKPREGGTHEPNRDPLIFRQAHYTIKPAHAHGNPF